MPVGPSLILWHVIARNRVAAREESKGVKGKKTMPVGTVAKMQAQK